MNTKQLLFGSLAAGALLALSRTARAAAAPGKTVHRSTPYAAIEAYVEAEMRRLKMPGVSLAIVEGDQIVHMRGFGRSRPGGAAPTSQTPFFIGSLTKSFTALAVMQLVEAGKVALDVPVQRYLPWFRVADPAASARISLRQLLNQTSGLPESAGEVGLDEIDNLPGAAERQARRLANLRLKRPVGSQVEYSNMNYDLLGLVIEAASGLSYADYVQKKIFTPLGMTHSYASPVAAKQNGLAMGYRYWFGFPIPAPGLPVPLSSLASGQLISTAADMARYLVAHMNGGRFGKTRLLSAAGMDELHRGALEYSRMGVSAGKYAMGWFDGQIGRTKIIYHSGTVPNFGAFMAFLPEQKKGMLLLFNANHWWFNPVLLESGAGAAALLASEKYTSTPFGKLVPWMLRGQLLIPAFQLIDVAAMCRSLYRWQLDPELKPAGRRKWGLHVILPLIPNLLIALTLKPMLGKRRGYLELYMPDFSWLAVLCGSFSLVWSFLRTGLVLRTLRGPASPSYDLGQPGAA